jgi:hypothetical protein
MPEIKLIRLQSGEDIICTCHEDLETKMDPFYLFHLGFQLN